MPLAVKLSSPAAATRNPGICATCASKGRMFRSLTVAARIRCLL